ncbi:hypothetical protein OF830_25480 [Bacillus paramycoides]|nr:hypothetical protein [Bacillus paramycoides]MCW9134145.1 hypothetical protein [Bacillus paramycoides]
MSKNSFLAATDILKNAFVNTTGLIYTLGVVADFASRIGTRLGKNVASF